MIDFFNKKQTGDSFMLSAEDVIARVPQLLQTRPDRQANGIGHRFQSQHLDSKDSIESHHTISPLNWINRRLKPEVVLCRK